MSSPLVSIGVTTYNRPKLLTECLLSILGQSFTKFEVIVGNDFTQKTISLTELGISDSRIRVVDHKINLGECRNMNFLLDASEGDYFTWLADDDAYYPTFLESVIDAFRTHGETCVAAFSNFEMATEMPHHPDTQIAASRLLSGREFLHGVLGGTISIAPGHGIFKKEYLEGIGGVHSLGSGFGLPSSPTNISPYSDTRLGLLSAKLPWVIYLDDKLTFFRNHDKSMSNTTSTIDAYSSAQRELLEEMLPLLRSDKLVGDFDCNLTALLRLFQGHFSHVMKRSGRKSIPKLYSQTKFLLRYASMLSKGRTKETLRFILLPLLDLVRG